MATGRCRHCGYTPVATNAPICPQCAGETPNPGFATRIVNWTVGIILVLILLGAFFQQR